MPKLGLVRATLTQEPLFYKGVQKGNRDLRSPHTFRLRQLQAPKSTPVSPPVIEEKRSLRLQLTHQNCTDWTVLMQHLDNNLVLLSIKSCCWFNCVVHMCSKHTVSLPQPASILLLSIAHRHHILSESLRSLP